MDWARATTRRWLVNVAAIAVALGGCSLLVDEPGGALRCSVRQDAGDDDEDPCPGDMRCVEGRCKSPGDGGDAGGGADAGDAGERCEPSDEEEICNGLDDDCDGMIDEGHDSDGDGITWCGAGVMQDADCDDFDAKTNPEASELCDGRDNDCDGEIDEDGDEACPGDQVCVEQRCVTPSCLFEGSMVSCPAGTRCNAAGKCVAGTECGVDGDCGEGEVCDTGSSTCVQTDKPNGAPCASNLECTSRTCVDAAALRITGEAGRVCGHACCSDSDCDGDEFCFASGSGARSCLPRSADPRGEGARPVCTEGSGCDGVFERCALRDRMSIDGGDFIERNNLEVAVCGPPVGSSEVGELCSADDQCSSGICEFPICSVPCGGSAECREAFGSAAYYCRVQSSGFLSPDYVSSCVFAREEVGPGLQGETCSAQADCAEAGCVIPAGEDEGFCANLCCNDKQCVEGTRCRPLAFGERYEMRCVP